MSLEAQSVVAHTELEIAGCKWLQHPLDPNTILGFSTSSVHAIDWKLKSLLTTALEYDSKDTTLDAATSSPKTSVDHVLVTCDKKHVLVQVTRRGQGSRECILLYVDTSSFPVPTSPEPDSSAVMASENRAIQPRLLPSELSAEVLIPLAFLPRDRLVFLSTRFSICVIQIPSASTKPPAKGPLKAAAKPTNRVGVYTGSASAGTAKEIFYLPGDWIRRDCLALCSVWAKERSFLCPRNGEVAIVRCAALA